MAKLTEDLMKKILMLLCCFAFIASFIVPIKESSANSKIDPRLSAFGLNSDKTVDFFVELNKPSIMEMATFGSGKVFQSSELMRPNNTSRIFYEKSITKFQQKHLDVVERIAPKAKIGYTYQYSFNGYYITAPMTDVEKIASMKEVARVFYIPEPKLDRTRTRVLSGAEKVWATVKDPQGRAVDGTGVLVSVSDSGLDYTHQDFGAQTSPVGKKIVISRDLGMNDEDCQEEEAVESSHGTACASCIAGDGPDDPKTKVKEKGISPKVSLAGYKIQKYDGKDGYLDRAAIMKSWDMIIKDKIKVSNNSYGASNGYPDYEKQQYNCALAGCTVVASNGNEGSPGPEYWAVPLGNTAASNSVIGVGATDEDDFSMVSIASAPDTNVNGKRLPGQWGATGKTFTSYDTPIQVVDCLWGRTEDFGGLDIKGKIALIQRGPKDKAFGDPVDFKTKVINAAKAGAKGVILYNHSPGRVKASYYDPKKEKLTDFTFVPSYELNKSQGETIRDQLHSGHDWQIGQIDGNQNNVTVNFSKPTYKGNIADFSSCGPSRLGYLKPDICSTGVSVHAAIPRTLRKKTGENYTEDFGGTSSAGPFVAGCAALITQGRPEWNPFEIKRAIMNTGTLLKRSDGEYYLPFTVQGMGRVNVTEAIKTQTLIQPPSALIQANTGKINIADIPDEVADQEKFQSLPDEIKTSTIPYKLFNYSNKPVTMDISFELTSSNPEQFDISATSTSVTIPASTAQGAGVAWVGINIKNINGDVKGVYNDIIIWLNNKTTNKKLHTGICIYNFDPRVGGQNNTFASNIQMDKSKFSPNGDGVDDTLEISYEVTNGSWAWYYLPPLWLNYGEMLTFVALDANGEPWSVIHTEEEFELGPGKFVWDGKDENGNYALPDGDWTIAVAALCYVVNEEQTAIVPAMLGFEMPVTFTIEGSKLPPVPTISAYVLPIEPGVGQTFEVGIYLRNAKDVKSVQFKMNMPGASEVVQYMGYEKGDFMTKEEPLTLCSAEYDKDKELMDISVQRPLDGVTGDGWVIKLKFMAKSSNYFDIQFSDLIMSMVDETGKETKSKAFFKNGEVAISPNAIDPADFNLDGKVNDTDLKIIQKALGSKDGDDNYNWRCDLNYDGKIDIADFAIFSKSYKH